MATTSKRNVTWTEVFIDLLMLRRAKRRLEQERFEQRRNEEQERRVEEARLAAKERARAAKEEAEATQPQRERDGLDPVRFRGVLAATGQEVSFKRTVAGQTLSVDDCRRLLAGEELQILRPGETEDDPGTVVAGRLAEQTFRDRETGKTRSYVGFEKTSTYDPRTHVRRPCAVTGRPETVKLSAAGHLFSDDELDALFAGEKVQFEGRTKAGKPTYVVGGLKVGSFSDAKTGKARRYVGLMPDLQFARSTMGGHELTIEQCRMLTEGGEITYRVNPPGKDPHKAGYIVTGRLVEKQIVDKKTGETRTIKTFDGRRSDRHYAVDIETGEPVVFKNSWGGHIFSGDECDQLVAGGQVTFEAVSRKTGTTFEVTGSLVEREFTGTDGVVRRGYRFEWDRDDPPVPVREPVPERKGPTKTQQPRESVDDLVFASSGGFGGGARLDRANTSVKAKTRLHSTQVKVNKTQSTYFNSSSPDVDEDLELG